MSGGSTTAAWTALIAVACLEFFGTCERGVGEGDLPTGAFYQS